MMKIQAILILSILFYSCQNKTELTQEQHEAYEREIDQWHIKRLEKVKADDGWLNLLGLLWLEPGANSFGSGDENKIVFPTKKIASEAGYFFVQGNEVRIKVNPGVSILSEGKPVTDEVIFHQDSSSGRVLLSGSLVWNVIRRDDKLGIRLRDLKSDAVTSFKGVDRFPVDPDYRVEARFIKSDTAHTINITNAIGQTTAQSSPGKLVFRLLGEQRELDVLQGNEEEFFIVFADGTTGVETYDGGRFIYVKKPKGDETTVIDFNKAYNPPCVFTPYATCPLPPAQNVLKIAIRSGEKNYHTGS